MPDNVYLSPKSLRDIKKLGDAYKAGDKTLQKRIRDRLTAAGKVAGSTVLREGAEEMPASGGLRDRIAAGRTGVTSALRGKTVTVTLRVRTREGYALRQLDQGNLRHPVFGNRSVWVREAVPAGAFSSAFLRAAPMARYEMREAVQQALKDISGKAT